MIKHPIMDYLRDLNTVSLVIRYLLAVLCGGVIGIEREAKHRPAGFRTHILACVGAATAMLISQYFVSLGYSTDVTRLGAQVISGIGFLGVGSIIVTRHQHIKGLTTAAGLWASACVGLAAGAGFYEAAIICTVLILITSAVMIKVNGRVLRGSRYLRLYAEFSDPAGIGRFIAFVKSRGIKIAALDCDNSDEGALRVIIAELEYSGVADHSALIAEVRALDGIINVEEL